jgi:AAA15 family ATPase/GTPase
LTGFPSRLRKWSHALAGLGFAARKIVEELQSGGTAEIMAVDGADLVVQKTETGRINIRTVKAEHLTADGDRVQLPFPEESDGTQRLTHLLPALHALKKGPRIFVVDEIDRSLHPLLAKGFVRTFLQAGPAAGGQLIFTTHETAFLDLELMRRDEIWFADKVRQSGTTQLYSLADYKVRTDKRIDKAYLEGRYEAVPPISDELPDWVKRIIRELGPQSRSEGEASA